MTWIQSALSFEKTHEKFTLNNLTWTDLTHLSGGSRLLCVNNTYILAIAQSTVLADAAFEANNFEIMAANAERTIPTRQEQTNADNGWRYYAKCLSTDILTFALAAVAVVEGAGTPAEVTFQTTLAHGYAVGDYVTIGTVNGSTAYVGTFLITAVTANTFTFYHSYTALTPVGTETVTVAPCVLARVGMP